MVFGSIRTDQVDIEKLIDIDDDVNDQSALLDYLDSLIDTPLNVNAASVEQLCTIPWISPALAARLVYHRYRNGEFQNIAEIKRVRGFSTIYD
ncbi:helix-hairpin-helix domain-containing protein, partial [candidate division KSB1 bacterium]|nr:helix-hairpin-helix domain-containing protein [candidate division KSB1 bacterium]